VAAKAEALEAAAKAKDAAFIAAGHDAFITLAQKLLDDIGVLLQHITAIDSKPTKKAPDDAVLAKLKAACVDFDMDSVDEAMNELEQYTYETDDELITWLREQVDVTGFKAIVERLK
jgi:predicted negative regulator of RcsB-dependent stress response